MREKKDLKKQIKAMEDRKRDEAMAAAAPTPAEERVSFDHWWIVSNKRLQLRQHMKEILWADFKARGLKKEESSGKYDEALKLFGL